MKKKNIIIIITVLIILAFITIILLNMYKKEEKTSIVIDVNYTESSNLKVSMTPSYSTIIYGTKTSKIKLNTKVNPDSKKNNIEWIINNDCATINENNDITINKELCDFNIYAKIDNINSNVLEFKITN